MRPRDGGGPNAQPQPLVDRQLIHSHATYSANTRKPTETNHPEKQDNGTRPGGGGTMDSASPPPLTGRQNPSPVSIISPKDAMHSPVIVTASDSPRYTQHPATPGDPHHLSALLYTPLMGSSLPPIIVPLLSPNSDTPWQLTAGCCCSLYSSPGGAHHDALQPPHTAS
jgi:hypothetical protein